MATEIKVLKCDYCGKIRRTTKGINTHETQCLENPNSQNCFLCEQACIDTFYEDNPCGGSTEVNGAFCKYHEIGLYKNQAIGCAQYVNCHKSILDRAYDSCLTL